MGNTNTRHFGFPDLQLRLEGSPFADSFGEDFEGLDGVVPVDAGVGDGLAAAELAEVGVQLLVPLDEVRLDHHRGDGARSGGDLVGERAGDERLVAEVLVRVSVGAIHHHGKRQVLLGEHGFHGGDAFLIVVRAGFSAAQDEVAGLVSGGGNDGGYALFRDREKMVGAGGGEDGVERELNRTSRAVLEADRHREAGCEFAVDLGFRGARADGSPGDQIRDVLRGDRIEKFRAGGDAHVGEVDEEFPCDTEALVDVEGVIELGIVDEAFPANGGSRFFEINPHDDAEILFKAVGFGFQQLGVFKSGGGIVDRARADYGEQAVIGAINNGIGLRTGVVDDGCDMLGDGQVIGENRRGDERIDAGNTEVVCAVLGHGADGLTFRTLLCQY